MRSRAWLLPLVWMATAGAHAQIIEFESGGLRYLTVSKGGVTVMFAHLPSTVRQYAIIQAAIANGSSSTRIVRPEDFSYRRPDGTVLPAMPARAVIDELLARASRTDVIRLVTTYEAGLFGLPRFVSTNGYQQRRQAALAEVSSTRIKAAAAASAIALVETRLRPGDSTDGAVFFATQGKPLGPGTLIVRCGPDVFEFPSDGVVR
ncbi:MAG: hypothetical protein RMI94_00925 [Bryobacterales bacterium]|nr:hypothetical protein [Bryobacteraceae bacterium]MDW8129084.1 hypothetical protein [Bryobacterales bacterium]